MSITLSPEDTIIYMESVGGRNVETQARTVKWGGQKCCRDHKIWFVGGKNYCWARSTKSSKTCSMFLKVPNTSVEIQVVVKRLNRGGGGLFQKLWIKKQYYRPKVYFLHLSSFLSKHRYNLFSNNDNKILLAHFTTFFVFLSFSL